MTGSLSVSTVSTPNGIATVLRRLSAGETIAFHDRDMLGRESPVFTLQKVGAAYVTRDPGNRVLSSASSFAEAWRRRPRTDEPEDMSR